MKDSDLFLKGSSWVQNPFLLRENSLLWESGLEVKREKPKEGDPPRQPEQGLSRTTPTLDFELQLALQRCYQLKKKKRYLSGSRGSSINLRFVAS